MIGTDFARMARAVAAALLGLSGLAACGAPADNSPAGQQFAAAFLKSAHDSCISSFTQHGGPADKAEPYCSCVVKQVEPLSNADKLSMAAHPEKMRSAAQTCADQVRSGG
jgi:hypothetical protein